MGPEASKTRIFLLGRPEIGGLPKDTVFPFKGFQLLALLAAAPSQRLPRRALAAHLWDSVQDDKALQNLRQLMARMRKAVPELAECLIDGAAGLFLSDGLCYIDLIEFKAAMQANSSDGWLKAVKLFRSDLLAGIDDASQTLSHWLLQERAKLREQYFFASSHVLMHLTRYGNASKDELREVADSMISLEPERESSYRAIIEAFGRNGMFEEAEQVYRNLQRMLKKEFNSTPSRDTLSVVSRVFTSSPSPHDKGKEVSQNWPRLAILFPEGAGPLLDIARALFTDVANELSKYRTFVVLAPHSSFKIPHDTGMPLDNSRLRADYSVGSALSPFRNNTALSIRLVDCHQGQIVWASELSLDEVQLYSSFRNMSHWIALTLAANIEKRTQDSATIFRNGSAYSAYLGGISNLVTNDLKAVRRARKSFFHALELDSGNSATRSKLSQTYYLEWLLRGIDIPELLNNAKSEAETAVQADPTYPFGHCMRGTVALHQREFDDALLHFRTAEALSPNSADTLVQHADALAHCGEPDQAWEKFERAIDINPTPPDTYWWAGASIAFDRQDYPRVLKLCAELSNDDSVLSLLAVTHALTGEKELAGNYYMRYLEDIGGNPASVQFWQNPDRPLSTAADANTRFSEGLRQAEEQWRILNGRKIK